MVRPLLLLLFLSPVSLQDQSPRQFNLVPEVGGSVEVIGRDGMVRKAEGFYQPSSSAEEDAPATFLTVAPGETIKTGKHSAITTLAGNGSMRLAPNSQVQISGESEKQSLKLQAGRVMLHIDVEPGKPNREVIINGQTMTVGMREGKLFVETAPDGSEVVGVHEGTAAVTKDGKKAKVGRGKALEIGADGNASLKPMTKEQRGLTDAYPTGQLEWKNNLIDWNRLEWWKFANLQLGVRTTPYKFEIEPFTNTEIGSGNQVTYETRRKLFCIYFGTLVDTSRIRDIPLAAEFWVRSQPKYRVNCSSKIQDGPNTVSLAKGDVEGDDWKRIVLAFEPFPPEGKDRRSVSFHFGIFSQLPAASEGAIRVIPGRILVLKK